MLNLLLRIIIILKININKSFLENLDLNVHPIIFFFHTKNLNFGKILLIKFYSFIFDKILIF
jgi:hypothetical protein